MVPKAKAKGIEVVSIDGADGWAWGSCLMSCFIARVSGDANWVSKAVKGEKKFTDKEFVDSLGLITKMVKDGVIASKSTTVDYGANISTFSNKKALFVVQGQWAAGGIDPAVANDTLMLAWPKMPGEKDGMANSVAAAIQVGYGVTKAGGADKAVLDASLKFIKYFNSTAEVTQRLKDGAIVAPILAGYQVPADLPNIVKRKVELANSVSLTDVIDAFLSGAPNDALNAGMQKIASGKATAQQVADEVQKLVEKK
jgi:raffinose/stachyose/melibiose transport system substrate-binding protein